LANSIQSSFEEVPSTAQCAVDLSVYALSLVANRHQQKVEIPDDFSV
jgi:hypothetical protein